MLSLFSSFSWLTIVWEVLVTYMSDIHISKGFQSFLQRIVCWNMRYLHGCRVKSGILERGYPQLFLIITLILTNPFLRKEGFSF